MQAQLLSLKDYKVNENPEWTAGSIDASQPILATSEMIFRKVSENCYGKSSTFAVIIGHTQNGNEPAVFNPVPGVVGNVHACHIWRKLIKI